MTTLNKNREDGKAQRKYRITKVEFDTGGNKALAKRLAKEYVGSIFLADNDHDADERAADIVSDASGWCVFHVGYEPCNSKGPSNMAKNKRTMDTARLLQELTDTMCQWDGESIAEKANEILSHKVKYLGDDMYEVIEEVK
jgi:hypothetical protein